MTPRERVNRAIRRQTPDQVPKDAGFTPAVFETFKRMTGSDDPAEYFGLEPRGVGFHGPSKMPDFSKYKAKLPKAAIISGEYGLAYTEGNFFHFTRKAYTLGDATTVAEVEEYPWPDITEPARHQHLEEEVAKLHAAGHFVSGGVGHTFETAWQILGFEQTFEHFAHNAAVVAAVLDHITDDNCFKAKHCAEAGVDMLIFGDDVGMQDRLMMHPDLWRRFLKPRLREAIAAARRVVPDLPVWYHSDGDITCIIDDLVEVGVTVLNPVQPECLDVKEVKRRYGDVLAFWGTIGTQTVMPFWEPDEVKDEVKRMIDLFAPGLLIAPTHVLEPDVPWENIVAFFEAVAEYGKLG